MVAAADQRLAEVDRVVTVAVVGPAGEGVALAGRGQGLAGDAVAVSDTLHGLIAIGKSATIGNIENRLLVVLLPLSINSRVTAARNDSLREVDGVISVAIVRPTKEVIALAGRLKRQACDTVCIGYALHSIVTVEERTAVGDVEDFDSLVLLRGRPSGEKGHILAATDNRLVEVNRVGSIAVIIPTGKHIAIAHGRLRHRAYAFVVSLNGFSSDVSVRESAAAAICRYKNNGLNTSRGCSSSPLARVLSILRRDSSNRRGAKNHTKAQASCDSSVKLPIHVVVLSRLSSPRPLRERRHLNCIINLSREKTQKVAQPSYI